MKETSYKKSYHLDGFSLVIRKDNEGCYCVEISKNDYSVLLKRFTKLRDAQRFVAMVLSF
jgi:hypothetical protein